MIEKKSTGPEQMQRFEESLRKLRDTDVEQRDKYKAEGDGSGEVLANERRYAYANALQELWYATGGAFGELPELPAGQVKSGE